MPAGVNNKDHKQVEKGPHLTLQRDRNLGETWSIIKLQHYIPLQPQDHVKPGLKFVPPTKDTTRVIPQGKDDEDTSVVSEDGPSLEFLKSVQKSNVKTARIMRSQRSTSYSPEKSCQTGTEPCAPKKVP